jgi:hypothetical protein
MDLKKYERERVKLINLAQDREKWRAAVDTVMNLCFPYNMRNFLGQLQNC